MSHLARLTVVTIMLAGASTSLAQQAVGAGQAGEASQDWRIAWRQERNRIVDADPKIGRDPTSILVQFKAGANPADIEVLKIVAGVETIETFPLVPGLHHMIIHEPVDDAIDTVAVLGGALDVVEYAEPDLIYHTQAVPNDTYMTNLWGMNNTGQIVGDAGTPNADIDAIQAWDVFTGNQNFAIGVCDTGIRRSHVDLSSNIWINTGEVPDGLDNDGNGKIDDMWGWDFWNNDKDPMDDNNHGSHVSGTIGGRGNNARGVVGVNWVCRMAGLKIGNATGSISLSAAIAALDYCVQKNIKVSNHSWGGGGYSQSMFNAISAARSAGHLFVAAAGNNGSNNDVNPFYPASYTLDNIISVAAIDNDNNKASFSNYGATSVDIAAPGVNVLSCTKGSDTSYAYFNGTSMASPHVAGVAALVWGKNPTWTYSQVRTKILNTAKPISSMSGRCVTGGCVNANNAIR